MLLFCNSYGDAVGLIQMSAGHRAGPADVTFPLTDSDWRVETDTDDRAGRKRDVLAVGRRDRATGADHCAKDRALHAADDAANDTADTGTNTSHRSFFTNALALED